MYCSVLRQIDPSLVIEFEGGTKNWNGDENGITVNGMKLWDYIETLSKTKFGLLKDHIVLLTRQFDARVKSFIKNILMGTGKEKVAIEHYCYRVEFQARGMPHIHGVAWISRKTLKDEFGIEGLLNENDDSKLVKLIEALTTCKIPKNDAEFASVVTSIQKHDHKDSCLKYGKGCRFDFPRLPSKETIITKNLEDVEPDLDEQVVADRLKQFKDIKSKAKSIIKNLKSFDITWDTYLAELGVSYEQYKEALTYGESYSKIILKREFNEIYINNYNEEMLRAWNGNMDLQLALDPYSIITYMTSYVTKDESGMTQELNNALYLNADKTLQEKLNVLKTTYLTHRQIGAAEAVYRIMPDLHLSDSNLNVIFLPNGFPWKRSVSFRKTRKTEPMEEDQLDANEIMIEGKVNVTL